MTDDEWSLILFAVVVLFWVVLPPKYDPLIWWREHLEGWRRKP